MSLRSRQRRNRLTVSHAYTLCVLSVSTRSIAAIPFGIDALFSIGVLHTALAVAIPFIITSVSSAAVDFYFYGARTWSALNIVTYNVVLSGGAGSELYGVEPASFYFKNLALNHNAAFLLAMLAPVFVLAYIAVAPSTTPSPSPSPSPSSSSSSRTHKEKQPRFVPLLVAFSPFPLTLLFFSLQPHKEERFMYSVYPLLLLGASTSLAALTEVSHARTCAAPCDDTHSYRSRFL